MCGCTFQYAVYPDHIPTLLGGGIKRECSSSSRYVEDYLVIFVDNMKFFNLLP